MITRRLRHLAILIALPLLWSSVAMASQATSHAATPVTDANCAFTLPNGEVPPGDASSDLDWFGSGAPDASLWLMMTWDDGIYQTQPPYTLPNPDEYPLKLTFWRGEGSGKVTVTAQSTEGERVSADVFQPFRGTVIPGIHPQGGSLPALGCWTFTATDGNDTITWTMLIASPYGDCLVSVPNGERPPAETGTRWYGSGAENASLWVLLHPQPLHYPPQFEPRFDGGHGMKTPFWRGEGSGPITLTGKRLDQPSTFEPHIDGAWDGYPIPGFIATGIWYPTEGCWQLTATDGNDTLTWTVLVESPFAHCRVTSGADDDGTIPETVIPPSTRPPHADDYYGENGLYITLGDPVRYFPIDIGSTLVSPDGAISDKFVWYREDDAEGDLSITVKNASEYWIPGDPQVSVPDGYGNRGVQASMITFPGPGCWQVTGTSGDVSVTFTVRYEIIPGEDWLPPE